MDEARPIAPPAPAATRRRRTLAAALGVAALSLAGGALVSKAVAAGSHSGTSTRPTRPAPGAGDATVQDARPDAAEPGAGDCPETGGDRARRARRGQASAPRPTRSRRRSELVSRGARPVRRAVAPPA